MNKIYRLTSGAESDTEQILRYTLDRWGTDQAALYAAQIEACLEKIATKQAAGRSFSKRFADAFVHRCQHHYIFFVWNNNIPIFLAILHENMDLVQRLGKRLGE
ncbi:MAG: type II toxin-antitoxin system RelE/ParE family toxin [Verrucomicrobia bacterium]|nr:type II toxin-antitoxin system RelE/ParE family toxin [Verrucomicrobiota bacterium]